MVPLPSPIALVHLRDHLIHRPNGHRVLNKRFIVLASHLASVLHVRQPRGRAAAAVAAAR